MRLHDEAREYESGVADVLSFLHGDEATVQRDVHLPAMLSRGTRQIDVLVRGKVFGLPDVTMVVECKRHNRRVNIGPASQFVDLLDDVGAELGMLVTTRGASQKALERLRAARGARARVLSLDELARWTPKGTVLATIRVDEADAASATRALRQAGVRVRPDSSYDHGPNEIVLTAFARWGDGSAEEQTRLLALVAGALKRSNITFEPVGHGVALSGGTPAHRWLDVTDTTGEQIGLKVLVSNELEVDRELAMIAQQLGTRREHLDVARPDGWPPPGLFGLA